MKNPYSFFTLLFFLLVFSVQSFANDLYWVNGSGSWNDPNHWSTSLNGNGGAGIPSSSSTVIINHNSNITIDFTSNTTVLNLVLDQPEKVTFTGPIGHVFSVQNTIHFGSHTFSTTAGFNFTNPSISVPPKQKPKNNKLITSVTVSKNNVTCFGAQDGKAWVSNITGSTGPFAYQWRRFSDNVIVSTTDTAKNLSGGLYSLRVTDLSDNTFNQQFVNIVEPSEIGTLIFPTDETCMNSCDGSINIAITGGTPPYNILWSNSATTPTIVNLCDGQYSVIITDANGCVRHDTAFVGEPTPIQPTVSVTDVDCFGNCNGSAVANPTGGTGVYVNYQWSTGPSGPSNQLTGLCNGTYSVTVTDSDGCQNSETFTVTEPSAPLSATLSATDALCFGSSTGEIYVTPSGGTSPYTYAWSDGSNTSQNRTNLSIGTYTVTVTDANNCTYVDSRTINQPTDMNIAFSGVTHVDCNGNLTGAATAVPNGGTPPYTAFSWSSGGNTATASGLAAGWHKVTVTDQNACTKVDSVLITEPTPLVATVDLQQDPLCNGSTDGIINTSPSGGTAPYSYAWSDGPSTAEDRSNLAAGTYSFTLTDDNGCTVIQSITLTDPPVLTVAIDSLVNVKCKGNSTGYARALAAGGTAPYSYQWSNSVVGRANPNIPAGSYTVTVTDAHNCTATTNVTITEPANALSVSVSKTDASCMGTNDGSATANPTGGTAPYSYNWGGSLTTKTINGLSAGTYTVTVTDNNGCTEIQSVTIDQPTALTVSINPTHLLCKNDNSGEAEAMPSGGTPPYSYLWSDNQNTKTAIGLAAGNYTVTVTDDNGCTGTANVTLTEPTTLTASISSSNNVSCNGLSDGSATVSASGGTASYFYLWNDASAQTTATANNLSAGNYSVTVTDANGCTDVANVTITQPNAISPNSTVNDVSCFGNADGFITINSVSGGTSPYSFSWSHGPTTQSVSNLGPGTYTLTITDNSGCTDINSFTITSPSSALSVSVSGTNNNCAGESIGSASASVSGGTPPYSYNWSNSQTTSSISNLSAGTYTVSVTDSRSCQITGSYTVTEPSAISISVLNIDHPNCNAGNDGSISVSASGGTGSLTYQWNDPASQTTATATGLTAGSYQVVVTDANGCTKDSSFILTEPNALDVTFTSTNVNCGSPSPDGSATANVTGGVSPYSYLWSNSSTSSSINNLAAGKYYITVTDANNCNIVDSVDIVQSASNFTYIDSLVNNRCFGDSLGRLDFIGVAGGTAPYSFNWSSNIQNFSGPSAFQLPAGNYSVTISDALGCDSVVNFTITEPPLLVVNLTGTDALCPGSADGSVSSNVTGGVPPYSYSWSNSQTTANLNNITAGTYSVTVTDANFCQKTESITIGEPANAISITLNNHTDPSCNGASDGSINISATGGTAPLTFQWNDPNSQTTSNATSLSAGSYTVTVTDANGCSVDSTFTLVDPAPVSINFTKTNVGCNSTASGSATANVTGGTSPYSYLWSNSATTSSISNLTVGNYRLTVTDANGCTGVDSVNIGTSAPYTYFDSLLNVRCFGDSTGSYYLGLTSGGTTPYTFTWSSNVNNFNNFSTAAEAFNLPAGNYSLTISDAAGCDSIVNFTITQPPLLTLAFTGTDASCPGYNDGSISTTVTGGVPPYTYLWSNNQSSANLNNITAGSYNVTVTDANSCQITGATIINEPANEIFISVNNVTNPSCNSSSDGSITVSAIGGVGNLTFQWDDPNSQTGTTASGLSAGTYTVTVSDANGCSKDTSIALTVPNAMNISFTTTNAGCNPPTQGSATASVTGGSAPYSYQWSNSATTASISNLTAGIYRLTVTDNNNCTAVDSVTISSSSSFTYIDSLFNVRCFGDSSGAYFLFGLSGGSSPYSFTWSPNVINFNNSSTSAEAVALPAGNYSLTISDAAGCDSVISFTITEPSPIIASFTSTMSHCSVDDGTATISASGGVPPYNYNWLGTSTTSASITGLDAGIHEVEVLDANFCRDTFAVSISDSLAPSVTLSAQSPSCFGANDGMAIASSSCLGAGSCSIEWLNLNGTSTNVFDDTLIAPAGTYVSRVELSGCIAFDTIAISTAPSLSASANITNQNCGSACNGSIKVNPIGGSAPYTFNWSPSTVQGQGTDSISALCKGTYFLTITDAGGCTLDTFFNVDSTSIQIAFNKTDISCHGANDGKISTSIIGGTPPYTYTWTGGLSGANPSNVSAGIYILDVMDNTGCSVTDTVEIIEPDVLSTTLSVINTTNCGLSNCDGSISIHTTGGTAPYNYELYGLTFTLLEQSNTPVFDSLCVRDYIVIVTDASGCKDTVNALVGAVNGPTASYSITDESCSGSCNGSITTNSRCIDCAHLLYDFNGNYIETLYSNDPLIFDSLCSASYIIRYVDNTNSNICTTVDTVTIGSSNLFSVNLTATNVSCNGSSDGSISSSITGGSAPYTYTWTGGLTGAKPTNISAGTYILNVTDNSGCSAIDTVKIIEPDVLSTTLSVKNTTNCGLSNCDGSISIHTTGGTAPYNYELYGFTFNLLEQSNTPMFDTLCQWDYIVVVTDAAGCKDTIRASIGVVNGPATSYTTTDENCSGSCDGSIITNSRCVDCAHLLYDFNGTYIKTLNFNDPLIFDTLCSGSYIIRYVDNTNSDACSTVDTVTVGTNNLFSINLTVNNVSCNGSSDGRITSSITGGTAPYTYTWTGGLSGANPSNVSAGIYILNVTDNIGCSASDTVEVVEPYELISTLTIENSQSCGPNTCDGSINISTTGGTQPYSYELFDAGMNFIHQSTSPSFGFQCSGDYFVVTTDANDCKDTTKALIGTINGPVSSYTTTNEYCFGSCDGEIYVSNPCTDCGEHVLYDINGSELQRINNTFSFGNLCTGDYIVRTIDTLTGCSSLDTLSIGFDNSISISLTATDVLCNGGNTGSISSTITGGNAPYTYNWTGGLTGANPTNLSAGKYYLTVTDANGCSGTDSIEVEQPSSIVISATVINASCASVVNGSITLNPTGGSGSYTYNWSPAPGSGQGTNTASGLVAGTYFVTVNDGACSVLDTFNVLEPSAINVTFSTSTANCGFPNGSATANISGGTSPYDLQWFDNSNVLLAGETNATLNNVIAGIYRLRVRDNNSCEQFFSTIINDVEGPDIILDSLFNVNCNGNNSGEIYISANDPNPPLTYHWLPMGSSSQDVQNLAAGTYTVMVENSLGCSSSEDFTITESPELLANFSKNNADCGLCNGDASITVSGGSAPYTYLWSNGKTTNNISNLCAGIYSVKVTDDNNCSKTFNVSISNSGGITGENITTTASCINSCNGSVTVNPIEGTPPYSYLWMHNGSTQNSLNNMCAGTYFLQITDFNSCNRIAEVEISSPSASLTVTESVTPSSCDGTTCDGSILLNVSGGLPPYSYSWSPGTFADTNLIKNLCFGHYKVTVTDANGCTVAKNIFVNSGANIEFDPKPRTTDVSCHGACDGGLFSDHTVTGQYMTQWLNDQGVAIGAPNADIPSGVCAGTYILMVARLTSGGCQEYHTVVVEEPDTIIAGSTIIKDLTCAGNCDGEINISTVGGEVAYNYQWNDPNNQTSNPAVGLCAGSYTVTVTDANGCTATTSVDLNEPTELAITIDNFTGVDCSADCDGTASTTIQGGVPPYSISWNGGQTVEDPTDLCYGENIITVTDAKGCTALDTVNIPAVDTVEVTANADMHICEAEDVVLSGTVTGEDVTDFGWYELPSGNLFTTTLDTTFQLPAGNYQFALIANSAICTDTSFVNVEVDPSPSIDANGPMSLYEEETEQVSLLGKDNSYTYDWTPGEGLSDSTIAEPVVNVRENTTYHIIATNIEGCSDMDSLFVKYYPVLVITNGITPNGDGVNDVWNIDFVNLYPDMEVTIFNRWGQEVFYSDNYKKPWDGTMDGEDLPVGTYYYILDLKDEKYDPITGPITIMR